MAYIALMIIIFVVMPLLEGGALGDFIKAIVCLIIFVIGIGILIYLFCKYTSVFVLIALGLFLLHKAVKWI